VIISAWRDADGSIQVSDAFGRQAEECVHEEVIDRVDNGHSYQLASPFAVHSFTCTGSNRSLGLLGAQCRVDEQWRCFVDAPHGEAEPRPELEINLQRRIRTRLVNVFFLSLLGEHKIVFRVLLFQ
jgi:hypothetical protein